MSGSEKQAQQPAVGTVGWMDLTVANAAEVRDFYQAVAGWKSEGISMGDYDDHCMIASNDETVAGICHAKGENANLPSQWLIYITVSDLAASIAACEKLGGQLLNGPRSAGGGQIAVIRDPAGAVSALYQAGQS